MAPIAVRAPGRVNLIGEHTDYVGGLVLPMAIDLGITITFEPTTDRRVDLTRADTGERVAFALDDLPTRSGTWRDYVIGTAWALREAGAAVHGFRGELTADLPAGVGLSSSAALEVAVAWALGAGRSPLADPMATARACQTAENAFVGVACGLMDQFASAMGVAGAAVLLDCRSLEHRAVPLPVELAIVIADSGLPRRLGDSRYAERRREAEAATEAVRAIDPSVGNLRDLTAAALAELAPRLDPRLARRARHVVSENARVLAVEAALRSGDFDGLGRAFAAGHASLRDDFEISTPEIDALVEIARSTPGVVGSRLTGGGFGGSTVSLVRREAVAELAARIAAEYPPRTGRHAVVREVRPSGGARRIEVAA